ncbi:osteopetrosis-associated transmembrane protein 1 [Cimex lectularius]|uniref:Osteopetrosis-associated transmembrane protein 1 n=1 Tax=Cimex lectularius TaxID=79782 RepID=A0A8I6R7R6_CIMLE|nr:osteopetrosis-associated transmembrane protein 1 [Cimex lectularius]
MIYAKWSLILLFYLNIYFVFPVSLSEINKGISGGCTEMLDTFAAYSANFTYCAIKNARPIRLCTKCNDYYTILTIVYFEILKYPDVDGDCRDELFNLDRLQVVISGYRYVMDLWNRASCDSCFKPSSLGSLSPELTDTNAAIFNTSKALNGCIAKYRNESVFPDNVTCTECKSHYLKLNELYNHLKADTGEIAYCMDIVDLINTTRIGWSKTLGCSSIRKKSEYIFWISSGFFTLLPILFYFFIYAFTEKKFHPLINHNHWQQEEERQEQT